MMAAETGSTCPASAQDWVVTVSVAGLEPKPSPERRKHLEFMAELTRPSSKKQCQRRAKEKC